MEKKIKIAYRGYDIDFNANKRSYILDTNNIIDVEIICVNGTAQIEGMTIVSAVNAPESAKVFRTNSNWTEKIGQNLNIRSITQTCKLYVREKFIVA